ncbi:MAG: protein-glutamate O-methyltransferase CheR [Candidatus Cloacimonetes bacterium]|nr:protein-glutamate O-methyltransferase CheR [Candidatus Cloacimonadota bacterium]
MLSSKLTIEHEEFLLLREYIQKECGIVLGDEKMQMIENHLAPLVIEHDCSSFKEFYTKARKDTTRRIRNQIIEAMTTHETLWFRDGKPWALLEDLILPKFISLLKQRRRERIRIWSAGAATGQEPYSIAILVYEALIGNLRVNPESFDILATDISPSSLYVAISGRYDSISMARGMASRYRDKYFREDDHVYEVSNKLRQLVSFKQFDLQHAFVKIPACDLILCRNVSNKFSPKEKRKLYNNIFNILGSDGFLILGSNEELIEYSDQFEKAESNGCTFYQPRK